jgi:Ca2+/H+ antiporter, TMEM165/GDT1 family
LLLPAELPGETALASLIFGSRCRPGFVFAGVAAAFALHVAFAVAVGCLLTLLPHRAVDVVAAVLFLAGAVLLLWGRRGHEDDYTGVSGSRTRFWRVAATIFTVILVAELVTSPRSSPAGLAARYHDPVAAGIGQCWHCGRSLRWRSR